MFLYYVCFHILNFRFGLIPGLNMIPVAGNADKAYSIVSGEFQMTAIMIVYILGLLATAWHLAYGFFLFAVDWGIVIGEKAQKIVLIGCLGLALFLGAVGINAAFAFVRSCGLLPKPLCETSKENQTDEPRKKVKF